MVEPEQTAKETPEVDGRAVDEVKPVYKRKTGKIKKKEGLALAASNKKMSSWLRNEYQEEE